MATISGLKIEEDGIMEFVEPANYTEGGYNGDGCWTLDDLQEIVGEDVILMPLDAGLCLVVVEDIRGKEYKRNSIASAMAGLDVYGDVLLCKEADID